jgi:hypothetical protein
MVGTTGAELPLPPLVHAASGPWVDPAWVKAEPVPWAIPA